ncbi:LTA synthase family protein [Halomonas halocynthiae]|uniref:LTA synthase family protein n=1 Tax=Halomonas halocynthiae TaxID=176290 RepID=UPI000425D801|nr:LTA synthase family protein [Halomonas halocynthiae]
MINWLLALVAGALVSVAMEHLVRPAPLPLRQRPVAALQVHLASWLLLYSAFLLVVQRPWFATAFILCLQLVLLQTNLAKWRSLKEPFLYQDFEYFVDAVRHPRLYLPFFGIWLAIGASLAGAAAIAAFLWIEPWLIGTLGMAFFAAGIAAQITVGLLLLLHGLKYLPAATLDPVHDLTHLGLYGYMWSYARLQHLPIDTRHSPAAFQHPQTQNDDVTLPDVIAVQSESFFDPRRWSQHVHTGVLAHWDKLTSESLDHGTLDVPAWGANTVRTEAAFLTGLTPNDLGVHRFSPYRQLVKQTVPSLLTMAKQLGYHTVVIHPYPASFYFRDRVMPALGADEFIDISHFTAEERDGQYISDAAVARVLDRIFAKQDDPKSNEQRKASHTTKPLFIYVITMENHGPLHLEDRRAGDEQRLTSAHQSQASAAHYHDLLIYLRHLSNADQMIDTLRQQLEARPNGGLLCWYGDHVPIMPATYALLGEPDGKTDYLIWSTQKSGKITPPSHLSVDQLGIELLNAILAHKAPNNRGMMP